MFWTPKHPEATKPRATRCPRVPGNLWWSRLTDDSVYGRLQVGAVVRSRLVVRVGPVLIQIMGPVFCQHGMNKQC